MIRVFPLIEWVALRPVAWRILISAAGVAIGLMAVLSPLSLGRSSVLLSGALVFIGVLLASLVSRGPVELTFLMFVALLPATRFSVLETSFSLQANFVVLAMLTALLVWRSGMLKRPLWFPMSRVHLPVLVFFLVVGLSLFLSAQIPPGEYRGEVPFLRSTKQITYLAFMLVTYATLLLTIQDRRLFRWALWTYIGTATVASVFGLYQFVAYPLGLPFWDLFPESASFGSSVQFTVSLAGGNFLRIWSVASEPVWFGDFLAGAIPVMAALVLGRIAKSRTLHYALIFSLGISLVALILTFARSAYIAIVVGAIALALIAPWMLGRSIKIGGIILLLLVLISLLISQIPGVGDVLLLNAVVERLLTVVQDENFGNIHRATAVSASWEMFLERPWGVGYGNYGFFFYDYFPSWGRAVTDWTPERFPVMTGGFLLRLMTETGLPGVLAFVWLIAAVVVEGLRACRRLSDDPVIKVATIGLTAGFISMMLRLLIFDCSFHFAYQWFFIAMIVVAYRFARRNVERLPCDVS